MIYNKAQRAIIVTVGEGARLKKDLPLLWLICSQPEAHLTYVFSRADFTVDRTCEELVIDAESIADVDLYLRDGLMEIRDHFWEATTPTWPFKNQTGRDLTESDQPICVRAHCISIWAI